MDEMINEVQEKSSQSPRKKSLYMIYNIQSKSWSNLLVLFSVELLFIHLYYSEVNGKLSLVIHVFQEQSYFFLHVFTCK